jgi:ribosomal protein L15
MAQNLQKRSKSDSSKQGEGKGNRCGSGKWGAHLELTSMVRMGKEHCPFWGQGIQTFSL